MTAPGLRRRLGVRDAVVIGLGAMLGTGVFTVFAPAAAVAGPWLLLGLVLAAGVATCNALSSADLAIAHPESGGSYLYGSLRLGHAWGVLAGIAFLVGKTASSAAAALVFGLYVAPDFALPAALAAVVLMTVLNISGVRWTARGLTVLVPCVLAVLLTVAVAVAAGGSTEPRWWSGPLEPFGVLESAALLFFAFAGYARITVLGEEVRDPARTIGRAVPLALGVAVLTYAVVALACLAALGSDGLAASQQPLVDAVTAAGAGGLAPLARVGAAVATLSVLLSVLAGVSRTTLAMARRRDLPPALATIGGRGTPWRADLAGAAVVIALVLLLGPTAAVALSAGSVLIYYAVANASALRLSPAERRWPRGTAYAGLAGCLLLAGVLLVGALT